MAPPSSRRSGHSRREQYSLFTGYLLASLGALVGAGLLLVSLVDPQSFSALRGAAGDAVQPAARPLATTRAGTRSMIENLRGFWNAGRQNAELRRQLEIARIRLAEARAIEEENANLRSLLKLKENEIEPVVYARLVGSSASSARRFAYLGAGRKQGVGEGMAVRSARGVVGRVLEAGAHSSRVMLLTDSQSVVPVKRAGDAVVAFAEGRGDGLLRIRLINLGINPLKPGDVFVTSGAGGYYRPGIAVGIVVELTEDGALARLIANPEAADIVAVEPIWQPGAVAAATTPVETDLRAP